MTDYLNSQIKTIEDESINKLLKELGIISRLNVKAFTTERVLHYIQQCLRPNGSNTKQILIHQNDLDAHDPLNEFILREKIKKLDGREVHTLCHEIATMNRIGIETVEGNSLYVFINKTFKEVQKKKSKFPRRY